MCEDYIHGNSEFVFCQQLGYENVTQAGGSQNVCSPFLGFIYDKIYCTTKNYNHISFCTKERTSGHCDDTYDCVKLACTGDLKQERQICNDYFFDQTNQVCKCQDKQFIFGNKQQQCSQCSQNYCSNQQDDCIRVTNYVENCLICNVYGYLSQQNTCETCDNSNCITCELDINQKQQCKSCIEGQFVTNKNNLDTCLPCDNTVCATCIGQENSCVKFCNEGCKTCSSDQKCLNCEDGRYLQQGNCLKCNNEKCGTCKDDQNTCIIFCHQQCLKCGINGQCIECIKGQFVTNKNNLDTCLPCDNTVCATCIGQENYCDKFCNEDCKTCNSDQKCLNCEEGRYLQQGSCLKCNNEKCGTCKDDQNTCIIFCHQQCLKCGINGQCIECIKGQFVSNQNNIDTCLPCDNTVCATCIGQENNCDKFCNQDCKTCNSDQKCLNCEDGRYLQQGSCLKCNNEKCGTCKDDQNSCIIACHDPCYKCGINGQCIECIEGQFVTNQNNIDTCLPCDNTVCATCIGQENYCDKFCNEDCKTCNSDQKCLNCEDGRYLQQGSCLKCNNEKCGTCKDDQNSCIIACHDPCYKCGINGQCIECIEGQFITNQNNIDTCLPCDNTVCATCIGQENSCVKFCNEGCKTCSYDQKCLNCEDGRYLQQGSCLKCNNEKCGTCKDDQNSCIIACHDPCYKCGINGQCIECIEGQFITNQNNIDTCLPCDNTVCATCIGQENNCDKFCNEDCKTCSYDQKCLNCEDGRYLQQGSCLKCNNEKCGTCQDDQNSCIIFCHKSCLKCDIKGQCIECKKDQFLQSFKDKTVCKQNIKVQSTAKEGRLIYF